MGESCETCRFSAPANNPQVPPFALSCRRRPPLEGRRPMADWPKVYPDEWCGEFEPRPAKVKPARKRPAAGEVEHREQG